MLLLLFLLGRYGIGPYAHSNILVGADSISARSVAPYPTALPKATPAMQRTRLRPA